jgi:hypothetical protein
LKWSEALFKTRKGEVKVRRDGKTFKKKKNSNTHTHNNPSETNDPGCHLKDIFCVIVEKRNTE